MTGFSGEWPPTKDDLAAVFAGTNVADTWLDRAARYLPAAAEHCSAYCRRSWGATAPSERIFTPTAATGSALLIGAAGLVSSVKYAEPPVTVRTYTTWEDSRGGVILRCRPRWEAQRDVRVTAEFDYGRPPDGVVAACCTIAQRWAVQALSTEGDLKFLGEPVQVRRWRDPDVVAMLEPHRISGR